MVLTIRGPEHVLSHILPTKISNKGRYRNLWFYFLKQESTLSD